MTDLRRKDKKINEKSEIEEILKEAMVGRLGTCVRNQPYTVPLSFVYNEDKIIFHSFREGKKMNDIRENPRVCFEVDISEIMTAENPCNYSFRYRSVIANGTAKVLEDSDERIKALRRLVEKYAPGQSAKLSKQNIDALKNLTIVSVQLEDMMGKKSPV